MEQATNQFTKGLQMDTNPMVQGNDTLTDCLNGTIITMNGNEPILQNDMGNRRVDRAFLPAGYEPVGIKEYGGIIYIAAYNPITNKSQIGSFPSPEKRINSSNENQKSIDISFGNEDIQSDTLMFPLTENNLLHAGDKFVVYGYLPDSIKENLTNYNNITGDKITSPKNKCYTLSLGILNSQNEFVDITKTLVRWEILDDQSIIDPTIIDTRNLSDEIKFNTGYFIPEMYKPTEIEKESINDLEVIKERLAMPANTYSYKLVGPLYLKAKLNHIEEFDYNLYGEIKIVQRENEQQQDLILYIEALMTYNCPDWLNSESAKGNSKYHTLEEYSPSLGTSEGWFILEHNNQPYSGTILSGQKPRYDENLNTYSIKLTKQFRIKNFSGNIFTGKLKVKTNSVYNAFWKPLEQDIYIDVSKLGSGSVELKGWRFTSSLENQISTLVYNFEAYPRYGEIYNDVELKFTDALDRTESTTYGRLNNGKTTLSIDWNKLSLQRRRLYQVDIKVTSNKSLNKTFTRWFLTTELMNSCFSASNDDFINDYGNPIGNEVSILEDKLTVKVSPDLIIEDNSIVNYDKNNIEGIKKSPGEFNVALNHKYIFNIDLKQNLNIINENLYPDYIQVNLTNNPDINITELNFDSENTSIRNSCLSMGEKAFGQTTKFIEIQNPISITGNNLSGVIKFSDKFLSNSVSPTYLNIKNPFSYVKTHFIETIGSERPVFRGQAFLLPKFGGISISYKTKTGPDDRHYLLGYFNTDPYGMVASEENRTEISKEKNDGEITFSYLKSASDMEDYLNSVFSDPQNIFILHFRYNDNRQYSVYYKDNKDDDQQSRDDSNYMKARVWWRTAQGGWGLCYTLFNKPQQPSQFKNDFKEYIKNLFGGRYDTLVYCIKDQMSCSEAGVYVPDSENYTYNNKYSIDKNLNIVNSVEYKLGNNNPEVTINALKIKFHPDINDNNGVAEKSFDIPFSFKSNDNFQDKADSLVNNIQLENIDIENCKSVDINGNKLNPQNIYNYFSSAGGYLVRQDMNLTVTNQFGNGKYNTLLIKNPKPGTPLFRYDFTFTPDSDHSRTYIDYSGFNVISSPYN